MTDPAAKILFFDIETAPNLGYVWGKYDQNVLDYEHEWYMLCVSYKWAHEKGTHVVSLIDFPDAYEEDPENDIHVVSALWDLLDEADVVIAHNGDKFDLRKANARFIVHGLGPVSPFKTVDTLKVARRKFMFNSNKLDDLGQTLGLGNKVSTGGYSLWAGVMRGDMASWRKMIRYAKQDTVLLVKVYEALKPWMDRHPNLGVFSGGHVCPTCGSERVHKRGYYRTQTMVYQRWQCNDCGSYSRSRTSEPLDRPELVPATS